MRRLSYWRQHDRIRNIYIYIYAWIGSVDKKYGGGGRRAAPGCGKGAGGSTIALADIVELHEAWWRTAYSVQNPEVHMRLDHDVLS